MTTVILIIAIAALILQNRRLSLQIASLCDRQTATENRLDSLGKKSKRTTNKQRAFDRKLEQQRKRQERLAKAQKQFKQEQQKQAASLNKLEYKLAEAQADIEAGNARLSQLFGLMDGLVAAQSATTPGSLADVRLQRQIISLENQIHTTEKRIRKSEFDRDAAKAAIAA